MNKADAYATLDADTSEYAHESADYIRQLGHGVRENTIAAGQRLIEVKDRLGHGNFLPWIKQEFDWSERTAQNLMSTAETFKCATVAHLPIDTKALYALAAKSTPEPARKQAVEAAQRGEKVTHANATTMIEQAQAEPIAQTRSNFVKHKTRVQTIARQHGHRLKRFTTIEADRSGGTECAICGVYAVADLDNPADMGSATKPCNRKVLQHDPVPAPLATQATTTRNLVEAMQPGEALVVSHSFAPCSLAVDAHCPARGSLRKMISRWGAGRHFMLSHIDDKRIAIGCVGDQDAGITLEGFNG